MIELQDVSKKYPTGQIALYNVNLKLRKGEMAFLTGISALPLMISGMRPQDIERRVHAALDKVNLLVKEKDYPMMLSAGEKQRVGIARAVVNKPSIILADEPTGNLDPVLAADIMQTFLQFNDLGATILIASHDQPLVERMGKRITT